MNLLLDTHAFLWFATGDERLSAPARAAISAPSNHRLVSAASVWEMAIKVSLGKLDVSGELDDWLQRALDVCAAGVLPVDARHALATRELPWHHRDPFDRLLIAQAFTENLVLVSADGNMPAYGVPLLW